MKVYCISGLGADKRVFRLLRLANHQLIFLDWKTPLNKESLEEYATRLAEGIDQKEEHAIIGLSFGGMIAVEIAKRNPPKHLLLISSVETKYELPLMCRLAAMIKLPATIPMMLFFVAKIFIFFLFGVKAPTEKKLLKAVMEDTDKQFLKWAIRAIIRWNNATPVTATKIHGKLDRIIPISNVKNVRHPIIEGGHLMILSKASEISNTINTTLAN